MTKMTTTFQGKRPKIIVTNNDQTVTPLRCKRHKMKRTTLTQQYNSSLSTVLLISTVTLLSSVLFSSSNTKLFVVECSIDIPDNEFGYVASTDVSSYLKIAYDIRDMRISNNDMEQKKLIYTTGQNVPDLSLQQLSYEAEPEYKQTPRFQIYQDSFDWLGTNYENDIIGQFDNKPIALFADTLVSDLFKLNITYIEATGSLIHNVLHAYWGNLWLVLKGCQYNDPDAMYDSLDTAVALYIGSGQVRNENNQGYMLYSLTENAGMFFNQDPGESIKNTETLELFLALQQDITNNVCTDTDGYESVRNKIQILYRNTNIVLMQWLLYHVTQYNNPNHGSGSDFIELFSLALWPQIHTCDTSLASNLINLTISTDVTSNTVNDVIETLKLTYKCLDIKCSDIGTDGTIPICDDTPTIIDPISPDYTPTEDIRDISKLDRDMNDIIIFMKRDARDVAYDYYQYGWHSDQYTLQDIATNALSWTPSDYDDILTNYYTNATMIDSMLTNFMTYDVNPNSAVVYETTTLEQQVNIVKGLLQGTVMYLGVIGTLEAAANMCGEQAKMKDIRYQWDTAAALYVGSMADSIGDGNDGDTDTGVSLWNMEEMYCDYFSMCPDGTDNVRSSYVLSELNNGLNIMKDYKCDDVYTLLEEQIKPSLFINLVRGYLSNIMTIYITQDGDDTDEDTKTSIINTALAYIYAYSYALRPIIYDVDNDIAEQVRVTTPYVEDVTDINANIAFEAIRNIIRLMQNIDCTAIGSYTFNNIDYGVCPDDEPIPDTLIYTMQVQNVPTTPSPTSLNDITTSPAPSVNRDDTPTTQETEGLAWGRYTFADDVYAKNVASFLLNVEGMFYSNNVEESDGNYTKVMSPGITVGGSSGVTIQSLQNFSTLAYKFMNNDPIYNYFRLALFEDETFDDPTDGDGEDYWAFANAIERLAIGKDNGNSSPLAAETVIILGVWHMIANMLYESVRQCSNSINSDKYIDTAVALWIGQDQAEGQYNSGWSIYYVGQQAAKNFGFPESEAIINSQLMNDFNNAQILAKSCADASIVNTPKIRRIVNDILTKLSTPLAQNLIYHMSADNFQYVELYALSVIPQGIACDTGAFEYLRDALFQGYSRQESLDSTLLHNIGKVFTCLRFQCEDLTLGPDAINDNSTDLPQLSANLCSEMDTIASANRFTSYQLVSTGDAVIELSRLDLDVLQVELLARTGEYNLSYDIYTNGRNSRNNDGTYNTLQELVTDHVSADGMWYNMTVQYFGSDIHPDSVINEALKQTSGSTYTYASRRQRSEIVFRTLQTSVTVQATIGLLYRALDSCNNDSDGTSFVDEAAALFIGSIEGTLDGGSEDNSGKFLYALGKEFCSEFNKCKTSTDAKVNQLLVKLYREYRDSITVKECDVAQKQLEETILNQLKVPLIQGLLYHASVNEGLKGSSKAETIAAGEIIAESILPMIDASNKISGETIATSMKFNVANNTVLDNKLTVFQAVSDALDGMNVDCDSVGTFVSANISACPLNSTSSIDPSSATTLGDDVYSSSTYVQDRAGIAKDIIEMSSALEDGRQDLAQLIYREGKNSPIHDEYGKRVDLRSLSSFSTNAADQMSNNPYYQTTVYSLRDAKGLFNTTDATKYADTIVQMAFAMGRKSKIPLASEAAVALNLWMEIVGELYNAVTSCMNAQLTNGEGLEAIDKAAAFWIGDGQMTGVSDSGHLLYALAEKMGENFGETDGETKTNGKILSLFKEIKLLFTPQNACLQLDTARKVRFLVDKIVSQMIVVQIQALIHYLRTNDDYRTFIYAHAFVPLVAACRPSTHQVLKEQLKDVPTADADTIVKEIRSTLSCFALVCDDVGTHTTEKGIVCTDPNPLRTLVGYKPSAAIQNYAKLDLDLLELDILMEMKAYQAAEGLYTLGKHATPSSASLVALSLQSLATDPGRIVSTQYNTFKRYYSDDPDYADTMVQNGFDTTIKMDPIQRRSSVVGTSKYLILFMAALQSMNDVIKDCTAGTEDKAIIASTWDQAAAYIIGSLEGESEFGSFDDGQVFWHLSNKYCIEFNTCSNEVLENSLNNDQIKTLLYAGSGAAVSGNCDEITKATRNIESKLFVPLIQGLLSAAVKLTSKIKNSDEKIRIQAESHIYAQALLPLVHEKNTITADFINKNFPLSGPAIPDGRGAVVAAFSTVLSELGVDCAYVGASKEVNACTGQAKSQVNAFAMTAVVLMILIIVALCVLIYKRRQKRLGEEKAEFLRPNGEFNHAADLLIVKTDRSYGDHSSNNNSSSRMNGDGETHCLTNYADAAMLQNDDDDEYINAISRKLDERDVMNGSSRHLNNYDDDDEETERAPKIAPVV